MSFRSYIRQFLGAILMLFRLSLPWGFAAGSGSIFRVAACHWVAGAGTAAGKQEEKVATIIFFYRFQKSSRSSSSRRKQEEKAAKSSFSMGFRRSIRQFLAAILMLFRPSLPWGFAAGSGSIFGVAACHRSSRSSSSSRKQEEKVAIIIFSIRFRRVAGAAATVAAGGNRRKKVAKIIFFYGFQKLH